ncbi:hypothetical protein PV416_01385 [Streptomyces ipomoeae]|jgi:hypothetical protein|uniref:hypothetical protein n=1 Tax=Streptomyces ipomoeae TaxID=103232 RepID=UPI0029B5F3EA|nr:hypothetical protein [Streptomyces ipomoeae]MDX2819764.1 hypothetical protein [Streptomyces ipomoeae]MDX2872390.1 hypothetical protein [Streptomyces ipomoeae]
MTGGELTLGAVLARLEEREREITAQAETTREQITQLTTQLDELGRAAEEVRITRKTLLGLPDPQPPAPPTPKLPDHPAYQQIMAVFTAADHPLRARQVCEAMDLAVAPNNQQRPPQAQAAGRPRDPGRDRARLVHPASAVADRCRHDLPACPARNEESGIRSHAL